MAEFFIDDCYTITGPSSIKHPDKSIFTINFTSISNPDQIHDVDKELHISYVGSLAKLNTDFIAPTSAIIPAGEKSVSIELVVLNCEDSVSSINISVNTYVSDLDSPIELCEPFSVPIEACVYEEDGTYESSCCDYVPKDFKRWADCSLFHPPYGHKTTQAIIRRK